MIKVNPDYSRAHYTLSINSKLSIFLPLIRKALLAINKPYFKLFGYKVISWTVAEKNIYSHHLVIKNEEVAYRADYKRMKIELKDAEKV